MRKLFLSLILISIVTVRTYSQEKKIMIFPSDEWCKLYGATRTIDIQGEKRQIVDYSKVFTDEVTSKAELQFSGLVEQISEKFKSKDLEGFIFQNLNDFLKNKEDEEAINDNLIEATGGSQVRISALDQILSAAKPEVKLELYFKKIQNGPRFYYDVNLSVINPYTAENIAGESVTTDKLPNGKPQDMIVDALDEIIFTIGERIDEYLSDVEENGQKIRVRVLVTEDAAFDLKDKCSSFNLPYLNVIQAWLKNKAVNKDISLPRGAGITTIEYPFVRMPTTIKVRDINDETLEVEEFDKEATPFVFAEGLSNFLNEKCNNCNATTINSGLTSTVILGTNR